MFKTNPDHPILHVCGFFEESSTASLHTRHSRKLANPTVPTPSPHSKSRYTKHERYTWNTHLLVRPEHAPVPPRQREVLEAGPAHRRTEARAHTAGRHSGILRREVRPAVGVEGADVVGALHVSGWMEVCQLVSFRLLVCVCVC